MREKVRTIHEPRPAQRLPHHHTCPLIGCTIWNFDTELPFAMLWRLARGSFLLELPELSNFSCLPGRAGGTPGWASVRDFSRRLFAPRSWSPVAESKTFAHLGHLRLAGQTAGRKTPDASLIDVAG